MMIKYSMRVIKKKSLVIIISDLLEKEFMKSIKSINNKHDLIVLHLYDEIEKKLDFSHNPFSMPQIDIESFDKTEPLSILAYQYDYNYVRPDSALKYYEWIMKYHQTSDQAGPSIRRIALINQILTDSLVTNAN